MNVTYIIPIKTYLAKYISPKDGKIYREGAMAIFDSFSLYYGGYKLDKHKILKLYDEKKLYKRIRPNQYPKEFLSKYPIEKYTYLKFTFPVGRNRLGKKLNDKRFNKNHDSDIRDINHFLDFKFWHDCLRTILYERETTIDQEINDFYSFYDLTDFDYKKSSFKTMLYKLKKRKFFL